MEILRRCRWPPGTNAAGTANSSGSAGTNWRSSARIGATDEALVAALPGDLLLCQLRAIFAFFPNAGFEDAPAGCGCPA